MFKSIIRISVCCALLCGCGSNAQKNQQIQANENQEIAIVNGETLTEAEFEKSQIWLPAFARQLDSNANIEIQRFWSLIQIMAIAQDARNKNLMTEAERSLVIKTALAKANIDAIQCPNVIIPDDDINAWIQAHRAELVEPAAFTVRYALVKNDTAIPALTAALAMSNGAQMGYNFIDPPELSDKHATGPLMRNTDGHPMDAKRFTYAFVANNTENHEEPAQLGPFTESDGLLFSCPEAIQTLKSAELNVPIHHSIACSGEWKAFVIPIWRRDEAPMTDEKMRQVAIEQITADKRDQCHKSYIQEKLKTR